MKIRNSVLTLILFLAFSSGIFAQSNDLNIYGYFQGVYKYFDSNEKTNNTSSFTLQQLNLIFNNDFFFDYTYTSK